MIMDKFISIVIAVALIFSMSGCGARKNNNAAPEPSGQIADIEINVAALSGPTGMGMAYLNDRSDAGNTAYKYNISYASAPDQLTGGLISKEYQIAALPVNLASVLYNKTGGEILTAAVNTLGVLYVVENGDSVKSIGDLAGRKIIASGKGSTPEYVFNYLLEKAGIKDSVEVEYVSQHDEAVSALASGKADLAMLPEPKVTAALMQIQGARIALDLTEEWDKVSDAQLVQGVIVVQKDFADAHPEVVEAFLSEYKASVDFTNSNMEDAAALIEKYGIIPKAAIALKAIPNCNIVCLMGDEMKTSVNGMLRTLDEANHASVGGSLAGDAMFLK